MISAGADEAELLPRHREDEVGLLLGHEAGRSSGSPWNSPLPISPPSRSRSAPG